jgi:hypothetical protein
MSDSTIPTQSIFHALNELHRSAQGRLFTRAKDPGKNQRIRRGYLTAIEEMQEAVREMCRSPKP